MFIGTFSNNLFLHVDQIKSIIKLTKIASKPSTSLTKVYDFNVYHFGSCSLLIRVMVWSYKGTMRYCAVCSYSYCSYFYVRLSLGIFLRIFSRLTFKTNDYISYYSIEGLL